MATQDPTQGEADNSSHTLGASLWRKTKENHAGIQVFSFIHSGCSALDQRKVTEVVITPSEGLKYPGRELEGENCWKNKEARGPRREFPPSLSNGGKLAARLAALIAVRAPAPFIHQRRHLPAPRTARPDALPSALHCSLTSGGAASLSFCQVTAGGRGLSGHL